MVSKVKLTFLGTSDAIPSAKRNHTSMLLSYNEENILFDCGEGTQRQFRIAGLNPCKITRVLISHWHGDHVLGIPGILQTLALSGYNKALYIYGPKHTKEFMRNLMKTFAFDRKYEIKVEEVEGKFFEKSDFYIEAEKLFHGIPTNAYSFVIPGQIRIDKNKLKKSGIPESPILSDLKKGKDIVYNGKKFKAKDLTFREQGKKISVVMDTIYNDKIISFVRGSDILISESSFFSEDEEKAKEHMHLTSSQAGKIAKNAKVSKLILTHLSQRYENNQKIILEDAKKIFKNSELAKDFDVVEL